jgi:hypothetical protein
MFKLEFQTDDEHLIALATAYWALDDAGGWLHPTVSTLEAMFSVPRGRMHQHVSRACVAKSLAPYCSECGACAIFNSRTEAESIKKRQQRSVSPRFGWSPVCTDCRAGAKAKQRAANEAKLQAHHALISAWLNETERNQPSKDYRSMGLREAFLLEGMLSYGGEAWRGRLLDGWERHQSLLCSNLDDCRNVYGELYRSGWLSPSPNSPLDAFTVEAGEVVGFDVLRVNWTLAADLGGEPSEAILAAAGNVRQQASAAELMPLWQWVSLCELRAQFNYCHEHWKFRSRGWTPTIESNLARLLDGCSLGVAKSVMWKCFKHLASELQKNMRPAAHTYNMLPGSFQRTYDHWRANGWPIQPWQRRVSAESVYTSLLFDRVLGGGTDFYNHLTGSGLVDCTPSVADADTQT